jgi:CubicO group peptidase (beta-lactamase class C family)
MYSLKMMSKIILISLLCYFCFVFLPIEQVSADQETASKLANYIESYLEEYQVPGASVAIVHKGEIFYAESWGVTGENEESVTEETPFTIGSISKSLTGLAIMKLINENIIELDDSVQKHLPWFTLEDKQAAAQMTIKQLLTQTSGLSTYIGLSLSDKEAEDFGAIQNNVKSLSNVKLTSPLGEKHQYSNANFLILGALIEEVTNQTYAEYMEQNVFLPLGMRNAAANHDLAYQKGYLKGYQSWFGVPRKSAVSYDNGGAPYGYITASAKDMIQYLQFLSQHDFNNFLSEENRKLYITPHIQTGENRYYGLGIRISNPDSKEEMLWHSGSTPDSHAELFYLPESDWGGVILTNKNNVLEEDGLYYVKTGMINILNGKEPVEIPDNTPIIQLVTLLFIGLLIGMFIYLFRKNKSKKHLRRSFWRILGIFCLFLAAGFIPALIYGTGSPWNTIRLFSPDIALLSMISVTLLALNGILSVVLSCKK